MKNAKSTNVLFFAHGLNEVDQTLYTFWDRSYTTFQSSTFLNLCFVSEWEDDSKQHCEPWNSKIWKPKNQLFSD